MVFSAGGSGDDFLVVSPLFFSSPPPPPPRLPASFFYPDCLQVSQPLEFGSIPPAKRAQNLVDGGGKKKSRTCFTRNGDVPGSRADSAPVFGEAQRLDAFPRNKAARFVRRRKSQIATFACGAGRAAREKWSADRAPTNRRLEFFHHL